MGEYKEEVNRLSRELLDVKRKFYEQKKKEAVAKEKELNLLEHIESVIGGKPEEKEISTDTSKRIQQVKYLGGGFAVK